MREGLRCDVIPTCKGARRFVKSFTGVGVARGPRGKVYTAMHAGRAPEPLSVVVRGVTVR